jgi:ABC-2 type transport system ATP-binding protein
VAAPIGLPTQEGPPQEAPLRLDPQAGGEKGEVAVIISTPYMDEAARCNRVGFMQKGRLIAEGTPGELRAPLNDRIVEVRGGPLLLIKQVAAREPGVEDVRAFGDRLHLRVEPKRVNAVIKNLKKSVTAGGGKLIDARPIPALLEDVFIALSEQVHP